MKIEIASKELKKALTAAKRAADTSRGALPILSYARIVAENDTVVITSTDLCICFHQVLNAEVIEEGVVTIPIVQTLKLMGGKTVHLSVDADHHVWINIEGLLTSDLGVNLIDEYPPMSIPTEFEYTFDVDAQKFAEGIQHVMPAVSTEEKRPILNGINWYNGQLAAADGYALAVYELGYTQQLPCSHVTINAQGMNQVRMLIDKKAQTVHVSIGYDWAMFQWDAYTILVRRLEGRFPDFEAIKPKSFISQMIIDRTPYWAAIEQLSKIDSEYSVVPFNFKEDALTHKNTVISVSPKSVSGKAFEGWYDAKLLAKLLKAFVREEITLRSNGPENPLLMQADGCYMIVMPMSKGY